MHQWPRATRSRSCRRWPAARSARRRVDRSIGRLYTPPLPFARRGAAMSGPRGRRSLLGLLVSGLLLTTGNSAISATATATSTEISLSRNVGPPTSPLHVIGRGFQPSETIDVAFDDVVL